MKAIIETYLLFTHKDNNILIAFNEILTTITLSRTENQLRGSMETISEYINKYFIYGFGSNHMWVKQKENPDERLIIVEF